MKKVSANIIYDGLGNSFKDHTLIVDDQGVILDLIPTTEVGGDIIHYQGALCPGFINTHCHVELSHLLGVIPTGTGLIPFIEKVVTLRNFPEQEIREAILSAMEEMGKNGIVALGDICNTPDTISAKKQSKIQVYNFIECFDLFQSNLEEQWSNFENLFRLYELKKGDQKTLVPHAPYSVSTALFQRLGNHGKASGALSMHNQETPEENQFLLNGSGQLRGFYQKLGLSLDGFTPTGTNSLEYALNNLPKWERLVLVHNTMTTKEDIAFAYANAEEVYWCSCPNANLYIENRLPKYQTFIEANAKVCLGTDSLASNWQLCILEEMKTIQRYQNNITLSLLTQWACSNGAEALGFSEKLGSFTPGKKPGVNHFSIDLERESISDRATVQVII